MPSLESLLGVPPTLAYVVVFAVAIGKSAGLPIPGTTTLIAAVVLASQGRLAIAPIVALAIAGATIGGHIGYLAGRHGGRRLITRRGRWHDHRVRALAQGEAFWALHGQKTVLVARLFPVLRHVGGFLAGMNGMRLRRFAAWNAAGAVAWATYGTVIALTLGQAVGGFAGVLVAIVAAALLASTIGAVGLRRAARAGS